MSQRSKLFAVLVCLGVTSSAWAAEPVPGAVGPFRSNAVKSEKAVGPIRYSAVKSEKAVGPFRSSAVKSEKAVGPLRGSAVHTEKTVGHDEKSTEPSPLLDLNAGF
jgi:hypothetical protein